MEVSGLAGVFRGGHVFDFVGTMTASVRSSATRTRRNALASNSTLESPLDGLAPGGSYRDGH